MAPNVDERKKVPHVWVVPDGTSTFSELENHKNEMFSLGLFEDAETEGSWFWGWKKIDKKN